MRVDCAIIGGGIVGLSVGMVLLRKQPGLNVVVLEKEAQLAFINRGETAELSIPESTTSRVA